MKYGIRLRGTIGVGGHFLQSPGRAMIAEHGGTNNNMILEFDSIADAEIYAQNYEINNYTIEPVNDIGRKCRCVGNCLCGDID